MQSTPEESIEQLKTALQSAAVDLDAAFVPQLADYSRVLWKWNAKLNLTRHTDVDSYAGRDLLDTIKLSEHLPEHCSVLDVGSGGGVPGIPLAILRPDLSVTLAESVGKKAKALKAMVKSLNLPIEVEAKRAEQLLKVRSYDFVTIRAVASLRKLLFWFQKTAGQFEKMLLIKGPRWVDEQQEASEEGLMTGVVIEVLAEYRPPGHDSNSVVLAVHWDRDTIHQDDPATSAEWLS